MSSKVIDTQEIGPTVAIVGAGASGTLLASQLLRTSGARVVLIERGERIGRGVAYGTTFPGHVLNVPAASMSGLPDEPDHFLRHLRAHDDPAAELTTFAPRLAYGAYLESLLAESEQLARPGALLRRRGEVIDIAEEDGARCLIAFADGGRLRADRVVLALGNLPPRDPALVSGRWPEDPALYVRDPWREGALERRGEGPVLLIGTGLTMVDIALQLQHLAPGQAIVALSRGGLVPHAHRVGGAPPSSGVPVPDPTPSLLELLRFVRTASIVAELGGGDWRDAINALRPVTAELWAALPPDEQRRFVDRLARFWDIHRHRLAPQVAAAVDDLRRGGRLTFASGRIRAVEQVPNGMRVSVQARGGRRRALRVASVVNCTGPNGDVRKGRSRLLQALCASGAAQPHPLALGLDTCANGALRDASGRASEKLFAIGPLRRGELWETTAVPEIRAQAQALAEHLAGQPALAGVS